GLATATTLKVMQLFGLISMVPVVITAIGLICGLALTVCMIKAAITRNSKPFEQRLKEHIESKTYANEVFEFEEAGKTYPVRIISNPENNLRFSPDGRGNIESADRYIVAYDEEPPEKILNRLKDLPGGTSTLSGPINGVKALDYTANPEV